MMIVMTVITKKNRIMNLHWKVMLISMIVYKHILSIIILDMELDDPNDQQTSVAPCKLTKNMVITPIKGTLWLDYLQLITYIILILIVISKINFY
jgi:hypothetical protein